MMSLLEKIAADPTAFSMDVDRLGPCKIDSPIRSRDFIGDDERILITENLPFLKELTARMGQEPSFERAGPRRKIFHDPSWSRVAIVTAGGLCPGLNHVIKALVEILSFDYNIQTIYGIRYGYAGLVPKYGYEPVMLDPDTVDTIHERCSGTGEVRMRE